jgi:hypothetical protein
VFYQSSDQELKMRKTDGNDYHISKPYTATGTLQIDEPTRVVSINNSITAGTYNNANVTVSSDGIVTGISEGSSSGVNEGDDAEYMKYTLSAAQTVSTANTITKVLFDTEDAGNSSFGSMSSSTFTFNTDGLYAVSALIHIGPENSGATEPACVELRVNGNQTIASNINEYLTRPTSPTIGITAVYNFNDTDTLECNITLEDLSSTNDIETTETFLIIVKLGSGGGSSPAALTASSPLQIASDNIELLPTAVSADTYTYPDSIQVDTYGRIVAISSGTNPVDYMEKIGSATGNRFLVSNLSGEAVESAISITGANDILPTGTAGNIGSAGSRFSYGYFNYGNFNNTVDINGRLDLNYSLSSVGTSSFNILAHNINTGQVGRAVQIGEATSRIDVFGDNINTDSLTLVSAPSTNNSSAILGRNTSSGAVQIIDSLPFSVIDVPGFLILDDGVEAERVRTSNIVHTDSTALVEDAAIRINADNSVEIDDLKYTETNTAGRSFTGAFNKVILLSLKRDRDFVYLTFVDTLNLEPVLSYSATNIVSSAALLPAFRPLREQKYLLNASATNASNTFPIIDFELIINTNGDLEIKSRTTNTPWNSTRPSFSMASQTILYHLL